MLTIPDQSLEDVARIVPRDVMGYARAKGWTQFRPTGRLMIFNRPEAGSLDQLLVPMDASRPEFVELVIDAIEKLVNFEQRPAGSVITDLLNYDADVLRFRIASKRTERGRLPFVQAIELFTGAKQSLLSAAHSVLTPRKHHPKLSRSEAVQLLDACQMQQTPQTSFVVAISCPMRAVDQEQSGLLRPFARQATSLLTRALSELDLAIEEDRVNSVVDEPSHLVSANLCEALLKMRPAQEDGLLEFIPSWAPSEPPVANEVPNKSSIIFSGDEFGPIEDVYRQLRPTEGLPAKPWVAFVDELKGTESDSGTREGEVVFTLFDDDQLIRAKASLTTAQYQVAYQAHNPARPLLVRGQLQRGPRVSRLTQISELRPAVETEVVS